MAPRAYSRLASWPVVLLATAWVASGCEGLRSIGAGKPDGGGQADHPADATNEHPGAGGAGAGGTGAGGIAGGSGTGGRGGMAGTGSGGTGVGGSGGVNATGGRTGTGGTGSGGSSAGGAGGSGCPSNQHNCTGTTVCVPNGLPNCCVDADCTGGGTGTKGTCTNNMCSYPCNTPSFKACNSACIPSTQCCTNQECATATPATPICTNGTCVAACKAFGATGCNAGGCCASNNTCVGNTCAETACQADAHACTGPAECCSGICLQGRCGCVGVGNDCRYDHDCCSTATGSRCSNNLDPTQSGVCVDCNSTGGLFSDCTSNADCCGLMCDIINGSRCDTPGITLVGSSCTNPLQCLSGSCAGVCQPTCMDLGATCSGDADCCSRKCLGSVCAYTGCGASGSNCITAKNCCSNVCQSNLTCL